MATISRNEYVGLYGPTTGDRIRLGDTGLFVEIERDLRGAYGDEIVFGGGKSLREGMGMDNRRTHAGTPDLVITNVTIIDAVQGVVKADVGIRDGRICAIGKAGNPQTMDGVTPGLELRPRHRRDLGQPPDPDGRRHRHAHPLHLAAAGLRRAVQRHHDADRRRHRPLGRLERDDGHAGAGQHQEHAARVRGLAGQRRHPRQGPRTRQGRAGRADRGRRGGLQVPRGLGHDARGAAFRAHRGGRRWTCRCACTPTR